MNLLTWCEQGWSIKQVEKMSNQELLRGFGFESTHFEETNQDDEDRVGMDTG